MIYPNEIKKGDIIGVTAPSNGVVKKEKINALECAIRNLEDRGYHVHETENVRKSERGVSSSSETRVANIMQLITNKKVTAIIAASGGDFLIEILPLIDLDEIKRNLKWYQGGSDITGLLFYITTKADIATVYGNNFGGFGIRNWHSSLQNNLDILERKKIIQNSFDKYEISRKKCLIGTEDYDLKINTAWKNLIGGENIKLHGRLLGGCIDSLLDIVGTKFDNVKEFQDKYGVDGIIWYFDIAYLGIEDLIRGLWQLKNAGWFKNTKGFLFGRANELQSHNGITYEEAIRRVIEPLNVPIILDVDIGHTNPKMTLINGVLASVVSVRGFGSVSMEFVK